MTEKHTKILSKYLPEELVDFAFKNIRMYAIDFTISKSRQSKLGDYRPKSKQSPHRLSVNGELSKNRLALTFLHELAHLLATEKYGWGKINAHGKEWKAEFSALILYWIRLGKLSEGDQKALVLFANNPSATTRKDPFVLKELKDKGVNILADVKEGENFIFRKQPHVKIKKNRTRSLCRRENDQKLFLISERAEISFSIS